MRVRKHQKLSRKNSVGRGAFVALALILQIALLSQLIRQAGQRFPYLAFAIQILAVATAIGIYSQERSSAARSSWIVLILLFPLPGLCLYLLVGQPWASYSMRKRFERVDLTLEGALSQDEAALAALQKAAPPLMGQARYLWTRGKFPLYRGTSVEYHPQGEIAFEALKAELRRAERFIFMEYHAIELSQCFLEIEEILAERAAAGVEVRLFYDDVGSLTFIAPNFVERMAERGIRCRVFNPLTPLLRAVMNNRDHRKITVIDGRVGFTGGYNLADEYFNVKHPYGHWKDTGLMLRGAAVRSLTAMFLEMWNAERSSDDDYAAYLEACTSADDGYVLPYADTPLDDERVGACAYMNLLACAQRYVWITTPYLIPDEEVSASLLLAAKRGVDVRIITPGIPDKKLVYRLTRSYYAQLARGGVRIYEYTPGFIHAKQMLADDESAIVGTINLDFRSLYLHFEDAVFLHRCKCIADIRRDFEETFPLCREVTEQYANSKRGLRLSQSLLRLFSPLL